MKQTYVMSLPESDRRRIQDNIEKVLSEILSDRYECKVTVRYVDRKEKTNENPDFQ